MKELPEELTLDLILSIFNFDEQQLEILSAGNIGLVLERNYIEFVRYGFSVPATILSINVDTLARLMEDWLIDGTNDIINTFNSTSVKGWVATSSIYNQRKIGGTRFEATVKLAHWVAKEKGYIK